MTKEIRPIDIPSRVEQRTYYKCTLCGVSADNGSSERQWWKAGSFEVKETGIFMKVGDNYPDGGWGTYVEAHICPDCFQGKVVPALEAIGLSFDKSRWDY